MPYFKLAMNERKRIEFDQGWEFVQKGITRLIKNILEGLPEPHCRSEDLVMLYTTIFRMCTQKPPHDYSQQLYGKYRESFEEYITSTCQPSRVLSPLVFFPISTHFTIPPEIPSAPTVLQLGSFHRLLGFDGGLEKPPTDALRPIISDNACILCITAVVGTELANAYSPDIVIASSLGKEVHNPWAFYLHAALFLRLSPIAENSPLLTPVGV
ncbi:hypothetical protein HHK36_012454 [Tetracentron sinense]|uniref:Cullin N-terminal domain-containing protein n=1 Tax=Tetracentron sinense TaxID=13715 RepID=A0A834Z4U4_TETSI|nr:hypothetical protein HHK36_012454 [Tetracentron sinense]